MNKLLLLILVFVFALPGPIFAAIVYSGSQNVTLELKGGHKPPIEQATISIAGSRADWDDFTISLEYLMDPMGTGMAMIGMTRLIILGGMSMGMGAGMGEVVGLDMMGMGQALNLAGGALIGPKSPLADQGLAVLLSEGRGGQTINGEFGASGGYLGIVMPGSTHYGWLHMSSMSNIGESNQRVTFDGWAYENLDGAAIRAGDTGVVPAPRDHVKWSQPPIEIDPASKTPTYCGWDEPCYSARETTGRVRWLLVADDFRCLGTMPIASVRWWGSYAAWDDPEPPDPGPRAWRIGFWSNVAADPSAKPDHSYPKQLLWQIQVDADRVRENQVGIDAFPQKPSDTCFEYFVQFKPEEYFWQHKYEAATQDSVFWISIMPLYPELLPVKFPVWGWKTRPWHWLDDAVTFGLDVEPKVGTVVEKRSEVSPIEDKTICGVKQSYDVAFELDTDPDYVKWEQAFTGIRNWPHYEDEESLAIEKPDGTMQYRRLVADDWKCQGKTPVTAIVWWGSYIGYAYEACHCEPTARALPAKPDYFLLSIWTNIPDPKPGDPATFSRPGKMTWEYKAYDYDEVLVGCDKYPETSRFDVSFPSAAREPVFRYSVQLPNEDWFCQKNVDDVYWLSIVAVYKNAQAITYPWGWTNHPHFFDDSAVGGYPDSGSKWRWESLSDQTGQGQDMSFVLFTEPGCYPCCRRDYLEWLSVGKPDCWCYPRQCHGDASGKSQGAAKTGIYYVGTDDLNNLIAAWQVKEPPKGPGVASIPNCICADFAHDAQGSAKTGLMRVSTNDLNILIANWLVKEPPNGPGIPPDCVDCP